MIRWLKSFFRKKEKPKNWITIAVISKAPQNRKATISERDGVRIIEVDTKGNRTETFIPYPNGGRDLKG